MAERGWTVFLALGATLACAAGRAQNTIPGSRGTTLSGVQVAFPDALKGKLNVLVVGFSHASQQQVGDWGRLIAAQYGQAPGLGYYEVPILAAAPRMLRGMIVKSMASSVPYDEKPHFLPLMEDESAWRAVAHYDKSDDAYVLLVDGAGKVLWQTEGDATDMAWASFRKTLDEMSHRSGTP